mmetsp:Transcript_14006/g.29293  ORF Transcript_14006/g.29293 Transcript_14006/m.29293 type:complete len:250 (-) Transcript_14006:1706-2455(-)
MVADDVGDLSQGGSCRALGCLGCSSPRLRIETGRRHGGLRVGVHADGLLGACALRLGGLAQALAAPLLADDVGDLTQRCAGRGSGGSLERGRRSRNCGDWRGFRCCSCLRCTHGHELGCVGGEQSNGGHCRRWRRQRHWPRSLRLVAELQIQDVQATNGARLPKASWGSRPSPVGRGWHGSAGACQALLTGSLRKGSPDTKRRYWQQRWRLCCNGCRQRFQRHVRRKTRQACSIGWQGQRGTTTNARAA